MSLATALNDLDEIARHLEELGGEHPLPDLAALGAWADKRIEMSTRLIELERMVQNAVHKQSAEHGVDPTLAALAAKHPQGVAEMGEKITRVRALMRALTASDARRHAMLARARGIVRAYLSSLHPEQPRP